MAKDYCRYKPVGIQAYGVKWDYSDVSLEPIVNIDAEDTNGTEAKASDVKKENETFSRKLTTWLNMSSNNDSKISSNQLENSISSPSKNSTPIESMNFGLNNFFLYKTVLTHIFFNNSFKPSFGLYFERQYWRISQ